MATREDIEKRLKHGARQSQAGDREAYRQFLKDCHYVLSYFVKTRVFDSNEREDVIQEILISVHKALPTYRPDRDFMPWLMAISRRRVIDHIRKSTRLKEDFYSEASLDQFAQTEPTAHNLKREVLAKAIQGLPENYRTPLELTKLKGLSVKETAELLHISEANVKTRCRRALKTLRKHLESKNRVA